MRICILTQPLGHNYGGLLQAYALQTVLKRMGHEVWTEDRKANEKNLFQNLKYFVKIVLGPIRHFYYPTFKERNIISQYTDSFIEKYITTTVPVFSQQKSVLDKYGFEGYIVGSDQVWRPCYSYGLKNYFLDFTEEKNVKRIAYAASFGTDEWEFTPEETRECARLARMFDAISVREDSGVELCKKYLGVNAVHLLDPTLLLDKEDYLKIVRQEKETQHNGKMMTYILDPTIEKQQIIQHVSLQLGLQPFSVMPECKFSDVGSKGLERCIFPSVTEWLKGFEDADFIVTDSFHGTVFSIIFNKPFIAIANKRRGISRFTSLLKIFNLGNRLVFSYDKDDLDVLVTASIDYERINLSRKIAKDKAYDFLSNALNNYVKTQNISNSSCL